MHHVLLFAHAVYLRCWLYPSTVYGFFGAKFAHANALSTARNSIDQVAWEPCQDCPWWKAVLRSMRKKTRLLLAAIWQLIRKPGLVEAGKSVCKYSFCLSWNPLNTHLPFLLWGNCLLVRLDGEYPSSCNIISRLDLSHANEIKNSLIITGGGQVFYSQVTWRGSLAWEFVRVGVWTNAFLLSICVRNNHDNHNNHNNPTTQCRLLFVLSVWTVREENTVDTAQETAKL